MPLTKSLLIVYTLLLAMLSVDGQRATVSEVQAQDNLCGYIRQWVTSSSKRPPSDRVSKSETLPIACEVLVRPQSWRGSLVLSLVANS